MIFRHTGKFDDLPYKFINKSSFNVKFLPHVFVCYLFLLFLNQISWKLSTEITKIINKKCLFSFEGMFLRTNENVAFELKLQNIFESHAEKFIFNFP